MQQDGALALALSGGGARGAYQVGILRFLARRWPEMHIPILTGVSAGAINAVKLANSPRPFPQRVERLASLWSELTVDRIFRTDTRSLAGFVARWGMRLVAGGSRLSPNTHGLVDTTPLREFLCRALGSDGSHLDGISQNIVAGRLRAIAVTTTDYGTGQAISWVQGRGVYGWERPQRRGVLATLTVNHVMGSAALPLFFPAIRIGDSWHGDGGIRLAAPLSPALHLGADRILAISSSYESTQEEANRPDCDHYPPPTQVLGVLLNAIFLDMFDADALQMNRMNALLRELPVEKREGLRIAQVLVMRPSIDVSKLASQFESHLPEPFRFMMRGLGTRETRSSDSLSIIMFEPKYIRALLELGERDAEAKADELEAFIFGSNALEAKPPRRQDKIAG